MDVTPFTHKSVEMYFINLRKPKHTRDIHFQDITDNVHVLGRLFCSFFFYLPHPPIPVQMIKKSKGKFLYSAVSHPQDRSKHFTLYFPDRPVHSDTISASLGSIQPYATINARRLLVHIHHLSIIRYSFKQLSELEQCKVKKLAQGFNTKEQDSNPCSRSRESKALPLNHCALQMMGGRAST